MDAGARSSDPVASAAASEEYGDDGAGESPESGESLLQVQEAETASALAESAARADKSGRIQPGDANLNVPFNAGPAASEGPPAARLDDGDGGVECDAIEDARHAPAPSAGDESMADTEGADGTQKIIKDLEDIDYGNIWSIDIICVIHNEIWEEDSDHRTWQHSNVVFHTDLGGLYASITRVPGFKYAGDTRIAFNVRQNSSRNHYIMYDQWAGAKLVSVEAVRRPDGRDFSKTVDFRQIFTTEEALQVSDGLGGGTMGYMGRKELEELKKKDQRLKRTTYHNGDYLHSGNIKDVIGVVRWAEANTRGQSQVQGLYTDYPKSDLIYISGRTSARESERWPSPPPPPVVRRRRRARRRPRCARAPAPPPPPLPSAGAGAADDTGGASYSEVEARSWTESSRARAASACMGASSWGVGGGPPSVSSLAVRLREIR